VNEGRAEGAGGRGRRSDLRFEKAEGGVGRSGGEASWGQGSGIGGGKMKKWSVARRVERGSDGLSRIRLKNRDMKQEEGNRHEARGGEEKRRRERIVSAD